ncbi:MAG: hypothetical protein K2G37_02465 [Clostridia bacterium]|nr:hypothetical protein [Clostridia bacterium]MDE7328747.1 hypothetical protein [Clostridia bacterium]
MGKFNGIKINKLSLKPYIKNYLKDNKLFLITFYGLFIFVFAFSLFVVLNYESECNHDNYYVLLMNCDYGFLKVTLKYLLYNLLFAFCATLTYRKKFAFAIMYFAVTFIAYRLAVNIIGSWCSTFAINLINAALFYFPIFLIFVITIVTIICYINDKYLYCSGSCPVTLKKTLCFSLLVYMVTSILIAVFTIALPLIFKRILF